MSFHRLPLNGVPLRGRSPIGGQFLQLDTSTEVSLSVMPVAGYALWLKGSISDFSGNNRNATPIENPPLFVTGLDEKPALRFTSSGELDVTPFLSGSTGATLYIVFTPNDNMYNLIQTAAIDDYWRFIGDGNGYIGTFLGARIDGYPLSMPSIGSHLISIHASGTSYEVRVDNISKGVQTAIYTPGTQFRIAMGGGKAYNGDISEVLVYPTAIAVNSANHTQNIDYFKDRYPTLVIA